MKKKLLCGILACMMTFSATVPLAACKGWFPDQGQTQGNGGQNPEEGNKPNGGSEGDEENPDEGKTPEGNPDEGKDSGDEGKEPGKGSDEKDPAPTPGEDIAPGTVIADEKVRKSLFDSLSKTEIGGISYSASAEFNLTGEEDSKSKLTCEGYIAVDDGALKADLNAYIKTTKAEEAAERYLLFYLRGTEVYYTSGTWENEEEIDFAALKEQLKSEDDPLVLERETLPDELSEAVQTPAFIKMLKNMPSLFDGTVTKTEGGYSLTFDAGEAVDSLVSGIGSVLEAIDSNHALTLGGLFAQPYLGGALEKLLYNVTAEEFKQAAEAFLSEDAAAALPEPTQNATAISYVEKLMRSGSFYSALTEGEEGWEEWKTFSSVPLENIISLITGEEFSFGEEKLADKFEEYVENLTSETVDYILDLMSVESGRLSNEEFGAAFRFEFDNDKKLMGFSVDAFVKGTRTLPPKSEEPQEPNEEEPGEEQPGENPDDNGEESENPGDDNGDGEGDDNEPGDGGTETPEPGDGGTETPEPGDGEGDDNEPGDGGTETPEPGDGGTETPEPGDGGTDTPEPDDDGGDTPEPDGGSSDDGDMSDGNDGDMSEDEDTPAPDDDMPAPPESGNDSEPNGPSMRTMKRARDGEKERKIHAKGSLKLETVSSSSPEFFDLTGCTYATEDGTAKIGDEE